MTTFYGPEYRVSIFDKTGNPVEYFKDFVSFNLTTRWSGKGNYQLSISGFDERISKLENDDLIVFSLKDPENGITTWYDIFTGFVRTPVNSLDQSGGRLFQSYGPSLEDILAKEYILWYSGSNQATKNGAVSNIMAEFVNENVGALALQASGRDADGVVSGLSSSTDGTGQTWSGSKSRKPLLKTLQDMRAWSIDNNPQIDFRIRHTGNYNFLFECGQLGVDRTTRGLDPTTGLNAAGNAPVVFSEGSKNIESFSRSRPTTNTISQVVALGSGTGISRKVQVAYDNPAIISSPVARRVFTITVNTNDDTELLRAAEAKLAELRPRDKFIFQPKDTRSVFNHDYFLGDFITAQDDGDEFHKQVIAVTYTLNQDSGLVSRNIDFSDV